MRTFFQEPTNTRKIPFAEIKTSGRARPGGNFEDCSTLPLQGAIIPHQDARTLRPPKDDGIGKSAFAGGAPRLFHDFTTIPVNASRTERAAAEGIADPWPIYPSARPHACTQPRRDDSSVSADGQPLTSGVRKQFERALNADFSQVRMYPHRTEITGPLHARAVTRGQNIFFHPGQFRPGTQRGNELLAHELAHTLQARTADFSPGAAGGMPTHNISSLERNADAIAHGETVPVLAAPAGATLCLPFDAESEESRTRRMRLVRSIDNALQTILRLLSTGGLVEGTEVATERNGVRGVILYAGSPTEIFVSYTERDVRLRRIVRSLMDMAREYRSAPIPAEFAPPVLQPPESGGEYVSTFSYREEGRDVTSSYGGGSATWADLQGAYERYRVAHGQIGEAFDQDWLYLNPEIRIVPGAARGAPRIGWGTPTGAYMVVPDIENEPLRYWHLTGFSPIPPGSVIVEFWHDTFGYYYMHRGQRIDVPNPWR